MAEERVQRRLAAILAADVVGYTRLMDADEAGTLARLKTLRSEVFDPKTEEFGGRIFKNTGDGALAEFSSSVDAVQCAVEIQRALAGRNAEAQEDQQLILRIGISQGDVIIDGEDLYGNGVNVAARMEGLAEPGTICVSGNVYEHVGNALAVAFEDLGEQSVKNIDRPVRCYRVHLEPGGTKEVLPPLSDKPAVAVLPFENMSGDPDQEYFADGLTEDIITALSLWRSFPVIARNSTFAYKGQSPDVRKVGKELGAGYVVEGSLRKAGNRVRVTAQLINAETGHHVWAERYDRHYEDIFDLQDEITLRIAATIEPELEKVEKQRVAVYPPSDLSAWEFCLKGDALIEENTETANKEARDMFNRAIELDPQYARAHTGLAFTYVRDLRYWNPKSREEWGRLFAESARRAVALDGSDAKARTMLARVYLRARDYDAAIAEAKRAVECNPYDAYTNSILGDLSVVAGQFEEGISLIQRARQLNPMDTRAHLIDTHLSLAHLGLGHYEQAIEHAREAVRRKGDFQEPRVFLASALGYLGRKEEATAALEPFGVSAWQYIQREPQYPQATKDFIQEGLRKAELLDISPTEDEPLSLPDKPSIAVLPFENMSRDPEQEYFADGITEDIITDLSKISGLFVIARHSSFSYKGEATDVRQVAHDLGVENVLEGSVRKVGTQVRINAQLIDAETGGHLWAERYDGSLDNIFSMQDEITGKIVSALEVTLTEGEQEREQTLYVPNWEAYDCFIKGRYIVGENYFRFSQHSGEAPSDANLLSARQVFERAIEEDPEFAGGYAGLSWVYALSVRHGLSSSPKDDRAKAGDLASQAVEIDPNFAWSYTALSSARLSQRCFEEAISSAQRAISLQPNDSDGHAYLAFSLTCAGEPEAALPPLHKALRLDPRFQPRTRAFLGMAYFGLHRFEDAGREFEFVLGPSNYVIHFYLAFMAATYVQLGKITEAEETVARLLKLYPKFTVDTFRRLFPYKNPSDADFLCQALASAGLPGASKKQVGEPSFPDKPSIAVLPFDNISGDPEQEYFADGIAEDIITALSRYHWFFVIARNSSFSYKGSSPDVRTVASELGVRYVLEGSVRKAGNRVRITAQLIDGATGNHVWAERYDRELEDIFAVQDEITGAITSAVAPSFVAAEAQRIVRKTPENLHAWDYAIHGNWHLWHLDKKHLAEAQKLFQAAIELDSNNVLALSGLALVCSWQVVWGWAEDPDALRDLADETARRAVAADEHDAWAQASLSTVHVHRRRLDAAARAARRALELNPNLAFGEFALASALAWSGDYDATMEHINKAERLSPRDPAHGWFTLQRAVVSFVTGRYEEQVEWAQKMTEEAPDHPAGWRFLAAGYGSLGREAEAREALHGLLRVVPHYTIELAKSSATGVREEDLDRLLDGLRKAGVPEN